MSKNKTIGTLEMSEALGVSQRTISNWMKSGKGIGPKLFTEQKNGREVILCSVSDFKPFLKAWRVTR